MVSPIPMLLIGAGQRGARTLATYALRRPEEVQIVAVAEPDETRREAFADAHHIPHQRRFRFWQDILEAPHLADMAIVAHPDDLHATTAIHAMQAGYHVLVETPLSPQMIPCLDMVETALVTGQHLIVNHSLRYTAFYHALHTILKTGRLGKIINYRQERQLPYWYTAHQFIRPASQMSNPLLFTEGIHEFDLMLWLLNDKIQQVSSVGTERRFDLAHAPIANVPRRCVDDCPIEPECPYSAIGTYLEKRFEGMPQKGFPHSVIANGNEKPDALARQLESSQWGACVYHQERQLLDYQHIILQSQAGTSISITLNGHSLQDGRVIQIDGTHASVLAEFKGVDSHITVSDLATRESKTMTFRMGPYGHGGDHGLMGNVCKVLRGEGQSLSEAADTLDAHLLAFATEEARQNRQVIDFPAYCP